MRPPPPGRRGPRRRGVRAGVTRTPVTVAASCSRKVTRTACQEAQGWLLTSCQVERTTGPRSSRLAGTRHGLCGQHEAGAALSAQHEGGVWTPVPARRNRPLPAGERGRQRGAPDSCALRPEGWFQGESVRPCLGTHGATRRRVEADGRGRSAPLPCKSGLGGGTPWAMIPQLGPSLVVKSAKPLPSHFFFWGETEPVGRGARPAGSCRRKPQGKIKRCPSIVLTFTGHCSRGFQGGRKTDGLGVIFILARSRNIPNIFQSQLSILHFNIK